MTPSKVFICGRNMGDTAALTADQAYEVGLPPANLQLSSRARLWQQQNANEVNFILSWPGLSEVLNFASLWRSNLSDSAQWRVRGYSSTNATGSAVYDSGAEDAYDSSALGAMDFGSDIFSAVMGQRYSLAYFLENSSDINSLKITITDTSNSDGFLRASRLYTGRGMDLALGAVNVTMGWDESTQQGEGEGGSLRSDGTTPRRVVDMDVLIDESQRAEFMDMCRFAGTRKDLFVAVFPGDGGEVERDFTLLARFTTMPKFSANPDDYHAGVYRTKLSLKEI